MRWAALPWWDAVLNHAKELFPTVSDDAWAWLGSLAGAEPPAPDPWALGTIASAWDQSVARARTTSQPDRRVQTRVRRKTER